MIQPGPTLRGLLLMLSLASAVVLTIAIGVGATSAMFSVVYQTLLRPLPYPEADLLAVVWERWQVDRDLKGVDPDVAATLSERSPVISTALPLWHAENHTFEDLAGFLSQSISLTAGSRKGRGSPCHVAILSSAGCIASRWPRIPARGRPDWQLRGRCAQPPSPAATLRRQSIHHRKDHRLGWNATPCRRHHGT